VFSLLVAVSNAADALSSFNVKPFTINLSGEVARMKALVANTRLPSKPQFPGVGNKLGADLDVLKKLQSAWTTYNWDAQQKKFNQ
jgi:hypothetical protein